MSSRVLRFTIWAMEYRFFLLFKNQNMKIVRNFRHLDISAAKPREKDGLRGPLTKVRGG
jgi:hypothetical protein